MTHTFLIIGGGLDGQRRELPITSPGFTVVERVPDEFHDEEEEEVELEGDEVWEALLSAPATNVHYYKQAFRYQGKDIVYFCHSAFRSADQATIEKHLRKHGEIQ
jgi:hypothetical protein